MSGRPLSCLFFFRGEAKSCKVKEGKIMVIMVTRITADSTYTVLPSTGHISSVNPHNNPIKAGTVIAVLGGEKPQVVGGDPWRESSFLLTP